MKISLAKRFDLQRAPDGKIYAPMSLGSPSVTEFVDYKVFKQTKEDRERAIIEKAKYKDSLKS